MRIERNYDMTCHIQLVFEVFLLGLAPPTSSNQWTTIERVKFHLWHRIKILPIIFDEQTSMNWSQTKTTQYRFWGWQEMNSISYFWEFCLQWMSVFWSGFRVNHKQVAFGECSHHKYTRIDLQMWSKWSRKNATSEDFVAS